MQSNGNDPPDQDPSPAETLREQIRALRSEVHSVQEKLEELNSKQDPDRLLTRQEASELLRVSTRTLDDLEHSGRLTAVRIGRRVLYPRATLRAFIRAQAGEGEPR